MKPSLSLLKRGKGTVEMGEGLKRAFAAAAATRLPQHIARQIEKGPGGCWLWTGVMQNGYGAIKLEPGGRYHGAHRVVYELLIRKIPKALVIDHLCRVTRCVNPYHMDVVTIGENIRRGDNHHRRKTHCKRGHEFTSENTLILSTGSRACRECARLRLKQWSERHAQAAE